MTHRLIPVLLLTATLYALGAGVAGLSHSSSVPTAAVTAAEAIPMLPTVTVRPDSDEPTLLPTVSVTPSASEIAVAKALDSGTNGAGAVVVAMHALGGGMVARTSFDMPYYSFGKVLPQVSRE